MQSTQCSGVVADAASTGTTWVQQDLSTVCWSLAKLNIGNRKLLDLIYNRILVDIPVLSAKDISYQLWGFAVLGYPLQSQVLAAYWVGNLSKFFISFHFHLAFHGNLSAYASMCGMHA